MKTNSKRKAEAGSRKSGRIFLSHLAQQSPALFTFALCLLPFAFFYRPAFAQSGNTPNPKTRARQTSQQPPKPGPQIQLPGPGSNTSKAEPKAEEETLRIESNLVTIVTSIANQSGAPLTKLVLDDFEILEDGVAQEVASFARDEEIPLRLIMLFDVSSSVKNQLRFERRAAAKFFERLLRPQDQAALFAVSTDVTVIQEFTNKPRALTEATKLLQAKGATSLYDAVYLAAGYLKLAQGRRIIVLVSDGGDTTSRYKLTDALQQAQSSDVVIFNVFTGVLANSQNVRDLAAERAMQTLTAETGGEVYQPLMALNGNEIDEEQSLKNLDEVFTKLADQLRTQYTLRFYSTNDAHDGKYRKLTVRVKNPGYKAKARAGYYAPK